MVNMNFYLKFQVYSNLKICWIFCSWKNSSIIATWKIAKMLLYSLFPYHLLFSMLIFMDISSVISLLPKMTRCHPHSPKIMQSHISPPLKKKKKSNKFIYTHPNFDQTRPRLDWCQTSSSFGVTCDTLLVSNFLIMIHNCFV